MANRVLTVGLPGLLLALLMYTFAEPIRRGGRTQAKGVPFRHVLAYIKANRKTYLCHRRLKNHSFSRAGIQGGTTIYRAGGQFSARAVDVCVSTIEPRLPSSAAPRVFFTRSAGRGKIAELRAVWYSRLELISDGMRSSHSWGLEGWAMCTRLATCNSLALSP